MGVKVKKRGDKWWVFINHAGVRRAKSVGSKTAAEQLARAIEAKVALGEFALKPRQYSRLTFGECADQWLQLVRGTFRPQTYDRYDTSIRLYLKPRFGARPLVGITREEIRGFLGGVSHAIGRHALRVLGGVFDVAKEKGVIQENPALKLRKFLRTKPPKIAAAMTKAEAEALLGACEPPWCPFFLTAVRTGLRRGELLALRWGDIQFGSESGQDRFILVQRTQTSHGYSTPKSGKFRRVDLSRQVRATLLELRDRRLLAAMMDGREANISGDLVFVTEAGKPIQPWLVTEKMSEVLQNAGLRHFRFHDLRHTFGSLLIQDGAPLAYVKEQMGHASISITVDIYGHLVPGLGIGWIDRLDVPQQNVTQAQPRPKTSLPTDGQLVVSVQDSKPTSLADARSC